MSHWLLWVCQGSQPVDTNHKELWVSVDWLIDWLIDWLWLGLRPCGPNAPRPYLTGPLCPILIYGTLLKFQMAPRLILLMSSGSKEEEPRYTCLYEAKASHSQRMWAEFSSSAPHLLHSGLSDNPIRWRCLVRVLCPVRRPLTALDCVLLKNRNLALAPRRGPKINSRACLWVSPRPRLQTQCWLTNWHLILLHIPCLESPKAGSGPTNFRAEPSLNELVSNLITLYSSMSMDPVQPHCMPGRDIQRFLSLLDQWRCSDSLESFQSWLDYQSRYSCISQVYFEIEFHKHTLR